MLPLLMALLTTPMVESPAGKPMPSRIGNTVPDFGSIQDIHRRPRTLADFKDRKAFVVVFVGNECPLVRLYIPTLIELHRTFADRGVQFLLINSNAVDSFTLTSAFAQERRIPFPVLKDFTHRAADAFGARRTPEAFLLDAKQVIRYVGRIDDQYGIGFRRAKPTRTELKDALEELLAGKPITTPETEAPGCVVARTQKPRLTREVTYTRDVAPIVQKRCQECHRPGEIGPFALLTYAGVKARAEWIHEVVREERMPPWHADPRHGTFANDRRLPAEEADILLAWIEQGCIKGDEKDLPPPATFPEGWRIGKPDRIVSMASEFTVPATGVLPYKKFTVDPGFKEDTWVEAAEVRPGNARVVHHVIVYIQTPGKPLYALDGTASSLVGWAPGDMPTIYKPGTAKKIPAGAKLVFEVHYTPDGTEQKDRSSVAMRFAAKPPEHVVETNILANLLLRIPPGAPNYSSQMTFTFKKDALILGLLPHMHLRGTSARYELTYPDGKTETILSVPDYDFAWQSVYRFVEPLRVPKRTKLVWSGTWDNSPDNPRNPDPKKEIGWGLQTWDEMHNGWMDLVWLEGPR